MLEDKRFNACFKAVVGLNFGCPGGIDLNFSNSLLKFGLLCHVWHVFRSASISASLSSWLAKSTR